MHGIDITTKEQFLAEYGEFSYAERGGGRIEITDEWPKKNLVTLNFPMIGIHTVHTKCADELRNVLVNILIANPKAREHYDGCWVPRHKSWNPKRGISLHSWAIAIDLNARTNCMGTKGDQPEYVVTAFESSGWFWGGRWNGKSRDPMHFQRAGGKVIF
jgi:hypothetical protein